MNTTDITSTEVSADETVNYEAHGCEISICGDTISVRDGVELITGSKDNPEWSVRTFILGQIHGILAEYTPAELIESVKKASARSGE